MPTAPIAIAVLCRPESHRRPAPGRAPHRFAMPDRARRAGVYLAVASCSGWHHASHRCSDRSAAGVLDGQARGVKTAGAENVAAQGQAGTLTLAWRRDGWREPSFSRSLNAVRRRCAVSACSAAAWLAALLVLRQAWAWNDAFGLAYEDHWATGQSLSAARLRGRLGPSY